jgi:hypothetical protein
LAAASWAHSKRKQVCSGFFADEDFQVRQLAVQAKPGACRAVRSTIVHAANVIAIIRRRLPQSNCSIWKRDGAAKLKPSTQSPDLVPAIEDDEVIVDAAELKRRVRRLSSTADLQPGMPIKSFSQGGDSSELDPRPTRPSESKRSPSDSKSTATHLTRRKPQHRSTTILRNRKSLALKQWRDSSSWKRRYFRRSSNSEKWRFK